jgi:hypothetical protein
MPARKRGARAVGNEDAIEWLVARVLEALGRAEPVDPLSLTLLLRRYCATGRDDLADALGPALARAAESQAVDARADHAAWLRLLVEAASVSDDTRIRDAAADLVARLRERWAGLAPAENVETLTFRIDACLTAAEIFDPQELVPSAIDELERVIGGAYRPGEGMAHKLDDSNGARGRLGDQVRPASALLTAHSCSGRLPYAMLAEELMQFAHRTLWDQAAHGFFREPSPPRGDPAPGQDTPRQDKPFVLNCEAARVLCRLAALHHSGEYRRAAVLAPDADYGRDAALTLTALEPSYRQHGVNGAIYGLALGEWLARP